MLRALVRLWPGLTRPWPPTCIGSPPIPHPFVAPSLRRYSGQSAPSRLPSGTAFLPPGITLGSVRDPFRIRFGSASAGASKPQPPPRQILTLSAARLRQLFFRHAAFVAPLARLSLRPFLSLSRHFPVTSPSLPCRFPVGSWSLYGRFCVCFFAPSPHPRFTTPAPAFTYIFKTSSKRSLSSAASFLHVSKHHPNPCSLLSLSPLRRYPTCPCLGPIESNSAWLVLFLLSVSNNVFMPCTGGMS
jgi:hypothetical protein